MVDIGKTASPSLFKFPDPRLTALFGGHNSPDSLRYILRFYFGSNFARARPTIIGSLSEQFEPDKVLAASLRIDAPTKYFEKMLRWKNNVFKLSFISPKPLFEACCRSPVLLVPLSPSNCAACFIFLLSFLLFFGRQGKMQVTETEGQEREDVGGIGRKIGTKRRSSIRSENSEGGQRCRLASCMRRFCGAP